MPVVTPPPPEIESLRTEAAGQLKRYAEDLK